MSETSHTRCIICKSSIEKGAHKCVHCNSYQRLLYFWGDTLKNYIAFIAVVLTFFHWLYTTGHKLIIEPSDNTVVQLVSVDQSSDTVRLLGTNVGTLPSAIQRVRIDLPPKAAIRNGPGWDLDPPRNTVIPAGGSDYFVFASEYPIPTEASPYDDGLDAVIRITVLHSDSSSEEFEVLYRIRID